MVFLCGTGISAPQLPDFKQLVDRVYERLGAELSPSQKAAYDGGRFEEVLGSLARDLAKPSEMVEAASALLAVPAHPDFSQVGTILRLSRDLDNRVLVVTTNFDTLLERSLRESDDHLDIPSLSAAGQALPPPGGANFSGIIHIHGRLADAFIDVGATPLVLTSSDYGDAYMRSGWASRFLFDLARCKTIVLVGYSANDAPVRYFLNVLEADRARFPDLKRVYAFDSYGDDQAEAERPWGTVAVTPLAYCRRDPASGIENHSPLWNDLRHLADLVERPKASREARTRRILAAPSIDASDQDLRELGWLFSNKSDLLSTAIDAIIDPRWFEVFSDNKFWSQDDARWAIPAWIARDFANSKRLPLAAIWQEKLGEPFNVDLARRLQQAANLSPFFRRAWRLLLRGDAAPGDVDMEAYAIAQRLQSGIVLNADLRAAVDQLIPRPVMRRRIGVDDEDAVPVEPTRFGEIIWADLEVRDTYQAQEIIGHLDALEDRAPDILDIATEALARTIGDAVDFEMIGPGYDTSDYSVPSIEDHDQNEHHDGQPHLVRALVNAHSRTAATDANHAREVQTRWWRMPGRLGKRLTLHALRDHRTASGSEAFEALLALGDDDVWSIRREIACLLDTRGPDADAEKRAAVEHRIIATGEAYYSRYPIEEGQADWRQHARDTEVWLRLKTLDRAGVLSEAGGAELSVIEGRRDYLDRPLEDQDFFRSYSSGVRTVVGDADPIIEATPEERLQVVHEERKSFDIERQHGWQAYCRADPRGALETLAAADRSAPNLKLWGELLSALNFGDEASAPLRAEVMVDAMAVLADAEGSQIEALAQPLADIAYFGPRDRIANFEDWCDRIWEGLRTTERAPNFDGSIHGSAINLGAGRLTQALIRELGAAMAANNDKVERQKARLRTMATDEGHAGVYARAIFAENSAYLIGLHASLIEEDLLPRMAGDGDEARAMREILIRFGSVTPELSVIAADLVEQAVAESSASGQHGIAIAAQFMRPATAGLRGAAEPQWGIDLARSARMLRRAPDVVRVGALQLLARWMGTDPEGREASWDAMVAPFFEQLWPREAKYLSETLNKHLVDIAVGSGTRFPAAFQRLRWYMRPLNDRRPSLISLKNSETPENFPRETLDLIWTLIGPAGPAGYDLGELLDRIRAVVPAIEVDRRFQSLDQRAIRLR